MDPSGVHGKKLAALSLVSALVLTGFILMAPPGPTEAQLSENPDVHGYIWEDSNSPQPAAIYEWIDAKTNGEEMEDIDNSMGYAERDLPFEFPYYGETFTRISVSSKGYLQIGNDSAGYSSSYGSNLPYGGDGVNGIIAVAWGSPYDYYTPSGIYGGIHFYVPLQADYVCVEWNTNSGQVTSEIILYSTGLIKMQWKDLGSQADYTTGNYLVAGIESPDGSMGMTYSRYGQANLMNMMAVEFSTNLTAVEDMALVNGGGDGHICYAEYGTYQFRFLVSTPALGGDINMARVYFGPTSLNLGGELRIFQGAPIMTQFPGSANYLTVHDIVKSGNPSNLSQAYITVTVSFKFEVPFTGNSSVGFWARGAYSLPGFMMFEDAFFLENMVEMSGDYTVTGNRERSLEDGDFAMENETLLFSGARLVYEHHFDGMYYPPNGTYYFALRDELNELRYDNNVSGRDFRFNWNMPLQSIRKSFTLLMFGIPAANMLSSLPTWSFEVDNTLPSAPSVMTIRADSKTDPQTDVDNDDTLFVSWSTATDIGSGIDKYRIHTSYEPEEPSVPFVDSKTTFYVWEGTTTGEFTLFVWAEDQVGHAGPFIRKTITIDKDPPAFYDFNIPSMIWQKSLSPECRITVKDNVSSGATGIWGESIEYSISLNGTEAFQEWISADVLENALQIEVKIRPQFEEGKNNYIKFRTKDVAGNGYIESEAFNIWIDVTEVRYSDVFPTQNVWHDQYVVNNREVEVMLYDKTSGVNTGDVWYRIATSRDKDGNPVWETGIAQEGNWVKYIVRPADRIDGENLVRVHFKYTDGFQQGEDNVLQFRTRDRAENGGGEGGYTLSPQYSIKINTQPVALIKYPLDLQSFLLDSLFTLDGSDSYDIDEDRNNLKYEWYLGTTLLGTGMILENVRISVIGDHLITLYVSDPVHRYDEDTGVDTRASATIKVNIYKPEPSWTVDSDGDGIVDAWEVMYQMDPNDPTDAGLDYDLDLFTNLEEYRGTPEREWFDPRDPKDHPPMGINEDFTPDDPAPFSALVFFGVLLGALILAALIVVIGFIRMNRTEDREKREETEEEAMLVTPQLDIPTMPIMPMVDTSIPTLPAAGQEEKEALPPAPEEIQQAQVPTPVENPLYTPEPATQENPLYQG